MSRPSLTFGELLDKLQKHYRENPHLRELPVYVNSNGDHKLRRVEFTVLDKDGCVIFGKPTTERPIASTYVELS